MTSHVITVMADQCAAVGAHGVVCAAAPMAAQAGADALRAGGNAYDAVVAAALAETVLLGNVALRVHLRKELTRKKLLWDAHALRFSNCEDANQDLRRAYREGWSLV